MESRRIEALVDGVFAVAMVLLVLQVPLPELPAAPTPEGVITALFAVLPAVGSFALSFLILGTLWMGHHGQFRHIRRVDRTMLWLNVFLLLCIAFVPFVTVFLARYPLQPAALVVYGGTLLLCGVFLFAHWGHAVGHGCVGDEVTPEMAESIRERMSMGMVAYLLATIVGGFVPKVGLVLFACVPFLYMLPSRIDATILEEAAIGD
ncbi:MAG: TMEM175 family protein [Gemmatimonadales bacterium]